MTTPLADKPAEHAETEEELLARPLALNAIRATEEAQGHIRWLRQEYQHPEGANLGPRSTAIKDLDLPDTQDSETSTTERGNIHTQKTPATTQAKPEDLRDQIRAMLALLTCTPQSAETLAAHFKRKPLKAVQTILDALKG